MGRATLVLVPRLPRRMEEVWGGGYVGSLDKVQRVSKKLFKRSELAMIGQSEGTAAGFAPCHFKVKRCSSSSSTCISF